MDYRSRWMSAPLSRKEPPVRDYYSQQIAIVKNGQITLQPAATSNGLLLLERAETDAPAPFDWHNATVYFVLTDRFENGDSQ
ncbi:alpha-amylase [Escherichia coli]|uniref:Alpha-amylase n=1 Tax=Escherichia coli TaxID=562 RepID=A0A377AJH5_ECOLX|nr:alpha-amylase [Escherichia coli]